MASKNTNLVLLTSNFPFGTGESFLDYELSHLEASFKRIVIISSNSKSPLRVKLSDQVAVYRYNTEAGFLYWLLFPFHLCRHFKRIKLLYKNELGFRKEIRQELNPKQRRWILKRILKAIDLHDFVRKTLAREKLSSDTLLYSYWLNTGAHAISLIEDPGFKKIARGHGSDVYEYVQPSGIHPMHHRLSKYLDGLFFISEFGKSYFEKQFQSKGQNTLLSRLGIAVPEKASKLSQAESKTSPDNSEFTIVSCSNVNWLKRLERIIDGLAMLESDQKVRWKHFGDGPLMKDMAAYAKEKLSNNPDIFYSFEGQVTNREVHAFYSENRVDLILNVSETEGIPVSIMEAQAYGIPAIATDVGGSSEIVNAKTGILLDKEFKNSQLVSALNKFLSMPDKERNEFSENCRANWNERYNAGKNFDRFMKDVDGIIAS